MVVVVLVVLVVEEAMVEAVMRLMMEVVVVRYQTLEAYARGFVGQHVGVAILARVVRQHSDLRHGLLELACVLLHGTELLGETREAVRRRRRQRRRHVVARSVQRASCLRCFGCATTTGSWSSQSNQDSWLVLVDRTREASKSRLMLATMARGGDVGGGGKEGNGRQHTQTQANNKTPLLTGTAIVRVEMVARAIAWQPTMTMLADDEEQAKNNNKASLALSLIRSEASLRSLLSLRFK